MTHKKSDSTGLILEGLGSRSKKTAMRKASQKDLVDDAPLNQPKSAPNMAHVLENCLSQTAKKNKTHG
jgi:hypothetical protein